jgi:hypothetical protein
VRRAARQVRLTLELLLGRRLGLFLVADLIVIGSAVIGMLIESGGEPAAVYRQVVLIPFLLLGLPALASIVDVERRAGCLDLALSVPSVERYFLRRAAAVTGALAVQGTAIVLADWLIEGWFPLLGVLVQVTVTAAFLGTASLFWAVRLRTAGGVWLASTATALALYPWLFFSPIPDRLFGIGQYDRLTPRGTFALEWSASVAVLGVSAVLFFFYARRRLRRPETLIS